MIGKTNGNLYAKDGGIEYEQLVNYTMLYDRDYNDATLNQCIGTTGGWTSGLNHGSYSGGLYSATADSICFGENSTSSYGNKYACTLNKIDMTNYVSCYNRSRDICYRQNLSYNNSDNLNFPGDSFTPGNALYIDSTYGGSGQIGFTWEGFSSVATAQVATTVEVSKTLDISNVTGNKYIVQWCFSMANSGSYLNKHMYYLALFKEDNYFELINILDLNDTVSTISELLANSEVLLNNKNAVNFMLKQCTGSFMGAAITSSVFLAALENSPYKTIIQANEHWNKFLNMAI